MERAHEIESRTNLVCLHTWKHLFLYANEQIYNGIFQTLAQLYDFCNLTCSYLTFVGSIMHLYEEGKVNTSLEYLNPMQFAKASLTENLTDVKAYKSAPFYL